MASERPTKGEARDVCFQCEQTARGTGCTACGICGKNEAVAASQDALTATLIRLAWRTPDDRAAEVASLVEDALFTAITNVSFDTEPTRDLIRRLRAAFGEPDGEPLPTMGVLWGA